MAWLEELVYWHWWVAGIGLAILEAFVPGAIFIWFGTAAVVVGVVLFLIPVLPWEAQTVLFTVLSVASIFVWRRYRQAHPEEIAYPSLNRRGEQYLQRVFTLAEPIVDGQGKVRVDDSTWKIRGQDMPSGSKVQVVAIDGTVLMVEAYLS